MSQPTLLPSLAWGALGVALLASPAPAQVRELWSTTFDAAYPPNPQDSAGPVAVAPNGAVYQAGTAYDAAGAPALTRRHIVLTRRDANGALQWSRSEPPGVFPINSVADLAVTSQDVAVVAGSTESHFGPTVSRRIVYRYDGTGALISSYVDGTNDNNFIAAIRLAANDDVFVAGMHDDRFLVERIDPSGSLAWRQTNFSIPSTFQSHATALATSTADDVWASGVHQYAGTVSACIARFGPTGTVRWAVEWPQGMGTYALDIAVDGLDQAYVCVLVDVGGISRKGVLALDPQGAVRWFTYLPDQTPPGDTRGYVRVDRFGRIVVLGVRGMGNPLVGALDPRPIRRDPSGSDVERRG